MEIKNLTLEELSEYLKEQNLPSYRGKQIFAWIYQKNITSWEQMTNLPKELRQNFIEKGMELNSVSLLSRHQDVDGTVKYLFQLADGECVESVFLPETDRYTVCFSTQAGCAMGCIFCATGQNGFQRNLSPAEIIDQILQVSRISGAKITNIVAMGQGEPLLNYDSLLKAIKILNNPQGLGLGARRITVSTCGIIPGIKKLALEGIQVNLAISLHAANDELRNQLMPINRKYPIEPLLEACRYYIEHTGRRVTFEYTLIDGINDRPEDLKELICQLSGLLCHINLIPFNPIPGSNFKRTSPEGIQKFAMELNNGGIETTVRKERGSALTAACGQLQGKRLD